MPGLQADHASLGLAGRRALIGRFDAVIDRVAQQVEQRVGHLLEERLVERDVFAFDGEVDLLAAAVTGGPHGALELRRQRAERHHAELHRLVLDFAREPAQAGQIAVEVADRAGDPGADCGDIARRFRQFACEQVEFGVAVELELVEAVAA